ncbi:MAG: hypothetical protein HND52_07985 [Ignavibacteriae bacterium]|nr:hypothetical protein [Ignavibacteriota bacterium]NOG97887.1 hypothetical protein [Ignavibacteriota bacterium]
MNKLFFKLLIIAFALSACEQSTEPGKITPPDVSHIEPILVHSNDRYTRFDIVQIDGKLPGFDSVNCFGGKEFISKAIEDSIFNLSIRLKHNEKNILSIFGRNRFYKSSDTSRYTIIHDIIPPVLISSSVTPPNPLTFEFDSPVVSPKIKSGNTNLSNLTATLSKDNHVVTFNWPNFVYYIGDEFPISIAFSDSANNYVSFEDTIKTKISQINPPGLIGKVFLSPDETKLFMLRQNFQDIQIYSIPMGELIKTISLDFSPRSAAYNQYNDLIYCSDYYNGKVKVVDPNTGNLIKEFNLIKAGNPTYPTDDPGSIGFGNNGIGIVSSSARESACGQCIPQIIDSRNNDELSIPDGFDDDYYHGLATTPFDNGNYIALTDMCTSAGTVFIFDCTTKTISEGDGGGYIHRVMPDKISPRFMYSANSGQFLLNKDGQKTKFSTNGRNLVNFTNKIGEENIAYFISDFENRIGVIDLISGQVTFMGYAGAGNGFIVTKDGNYILNIFDSVINIFSPSIFR